MIDNLNIRLAEGDDTALADCFREHGSLLRSYLRRFVPPQEVEDLQQIVFAEVWRCRHRFDPGRSLPAWLIGIAHNRAVDHLRVHTLQTVPLDVVADPAAWTAGTTETAWPSATRSSGRWRSFPPRSARPSSWPTTVS